MNLSHALRSRRALVPAVMVAALVSAVLMAPTSDARPARPAAAAHALNARQVAFHDAMRKLWEDHVTWTRLAIVSFAAGLPDLQATEARLLQNQVDIGNAVKPFYGSAAGNKLTALLKEHILGAVALLQAAKSGDSGAIAKASAAWYANGRQVADFLHAANPRNWARGEMRAMMKTHLDQTLKEAQDRLQGRYAADIRDYEAVHRHILAMADELNDGIIRQFPGRFGAARSASARALCVLDRSRDGEQLL
jgi:hypothetical protein